MPDHLRDLRDNFGRLFMRDLAAVRREIESYPDEESLWRQIPGMANAGGNLALHLAGNLQLFVGDTLGGIKYARDREREFSARGVSREVVVKGIDDTIRAVTTAMQTVDPARLTQPYPIEILNTTLRTDAMLFHLATHLTYHLGQIDYHRRAATQSNTTVGTVSIPALNDPWPPVLA